MKKIFIILLLAVISLSVKATDYYIATAANGGSNSNNGSIGSPWLTLAYACSHVSVGAHTIHVGVGTFVETYQSVLALGVSIEGAGITSIIQSDYGSSYLISLWSASEGTNGNQHISNIKMDGNNLIGWAAIQVYRRKNVSINNCTFQNFNYWGVSFEGSGSATGPVTWATGNTFYNNFLTNCGGYSWDGVTGTPRDNGSGCAQLQMSGQDGLLVYNNTFIGGNRGTWHDGWSIKGLYGYNKDCKIHDNTMTHPPFTGETWEFAIELWMQRGGIEIYNNTITNGSIDISGSGDAAGLSTIKGNYSYGVWIHDNSIIYADGSLIESRGILIEQSAESVIIERNHIKNARYGIYCPLLAHDNADPGKRFEDIRISYNIMENVGSDYLDIYDGRGYGIYMPISPVLTTGWICNNVNIWNNVIQARTTEYRPYYGIVLPVMGTTTNISVRNNIITGFLTSAIYGKGVSGVTLDYLYIQNNILYNNGNSNNVLFNSLTPTNYTYTSNLLGPAYNPLFVSSTDFHLQTGSPAINSGIDVGLPIDFDSVIVAATPERGAYEYGSTVLVTSITVSGTGGATTITTAGGTLQMLADILPANATNPAVTWSWINGTGTGYVDGSGLLTAITDGTITVWATAVDGSGVSDGQVITMSNQPAPLGLLDGLVAYYPLNETGAGSMAYDATANDHDLPNTGATTNQAGKVGTSFSFAGSVNSFLGGIDIPAFEFTTALSVSAWINPASTTSWQGLVTYYYYGDDSGWDMNVDYQDKAALAVRSPSQTPNGTYALGTTVLGTGTWIHVACTWDGSYVRTYVNGTLESTSTSWNHPITYNSLARFMIGMRYNDIPYTGRIDEVALYNRAISQTNVTDLKAAGEAGLSYPFIEATLPTVVTDSLIINETGFTGVLYSTVTNDGNANIDTSGYVSGLSPNPIWEYPNGWFSIRIDQEEEGIQFNFPVGAQGWYNTTFYYRPFAINSAGISYGTQVSFTTPVAPVRPKYAKHNGKFIRINGKFLKL